LAGCGGWGEEPPDGGPSAGPSFSGGSGPTGEPPTTPAPGTPVPLTVTPADDGRVFTMRAGQTAELVVADPDAPDPGVEGTSVLVVPVVNVQASGRREWELRAIAPGRTTIRAGGTQSYAITLVVGDP